MSWFTDIADRVQAFKAQNEADAKAGNAWYDNVGDKINSAVDTVQEQAGLYADQATQAYNEFQDYRADNKQKLQDGTSMYHQAVNKAREYADSAVQAVQDAPANIQQYMSAEERAIRAEEERQMNYFQVDAGKQALTDQSAEMIPLSRAMSKGYQSGMRPIIQDAAEKVVKVGQVEGTKQFAPAGLVAGRENMENFLAQHMQLSRLPKSTHELQQLAVARKLGQQQTKRQFEVIDPAIHQATEDLGVNAARVKAGLPGQKAYMQQVAANTMDPVKVAAEKKYWLDGMAQQKIDSDNYFYN
jgi:hypothetical protein